MAEVTHTLETLANLHRAKGRGLKIWAGQITVTEVYELHTGMDHIYGCAFTPVEADNVDAESSHVLISSISGGVITFETGDIDDYTDLTPVAYGIVIGRVN